MAHARCMLDNEGYKHALSICNSYCFFYDKSGYANAPGCRICAYIACLVVMVCLRKIAIFGNGKTNALLLLRSLDKSGDRVYK